jgi:hypothetical protein
MAQETQPANPAPNGSRRAIIIGLISSLIGSILFSIFFQPILNVVSDGIVSIINFFYRGYIDNLYREASGNPSELLLALIFYTTVTGPIIILASVAIMFYQSNYKKQGESNGKEQNRLSVYVIFVIILVFLVMTAITIAGPTISVGLHSRFQRQIMALDPVISDQERKEMFGMWAEMKSKSDYDQIQSALKDLSNKYHRELPRQSPSGSVRP